MCRLKLKFISVPTAIGAFLLSACASPTASGVGLTIESDAPLGQSQHIDLAVLQNIEYQGAKFPFPARFQLVNGIVHPPAGDYMGKAYIKLAELAALGDLNGDGIGDAVVILEGWFGGTGIFKELAAVINRNGQPLNIAVEDLGDRIVIIALSVQNQAIVLDVLAHADGDPLCCPSQNSTLRFKLSDNQLVELPVNSQ